METKLPEHAIDLSRKIFLIGKRYHERNNAERDLFSHLKNVKRISTEKRRRNISNDIEKMEAKITSLIEKEKKISNEHFLTTDERNELKKAIDRLEKDLESEREVKTIDERKLKEKIEELESNEEHFKKRIEALEIEIARERESKEAISIKNKEQINSLSAMVAKVKRDFNEYLKKEGSEKEKRRKLLKSLDARIIKDVDVEDYLEN